MRVGISGAHGTGKTTLAEALCARLPGHVTADEPYYLLEDEGYEFGFPSSPEDYRALLAPLGGLGEVGHAAYLPYSGSTPKVLNAIASRT